MPSTSLRSISSRCRTPLTGTPIVTFECLRRPELKPPPTAHDYPVRQPRPHGTAALPRWRSRLCLHRPYAHALDRSLTRAEEDRPTPPRPSVTPFALCLPIAIQVHSVFRVSQLKPESPNPSDDRELPPPPLIVDSILEYFRTPLTTHPESYYQTLFTNGPWLRTPCERLRLLPCRSYTTSALQTRLRQSISVTHSTTAPLRHHPCFRPVTSSPTQVSLNLCPRGLGRKKGDTVRNVVDL
jgi:hypothetical protein